MTARARADSAYDRLAERFARLSEIDGALAVLGWDAAVMMPKGAAQARGGQTAALQRLSHDLLTAAETGDLLDQAEAEAGKDAPDPWRAANLLEMRRAYFDATCLEPSLVEAIARATTSCEVIWRDARAKADFEELRPSFEEVVRLAVRAAEAKADASGLTPYDALLDRFQPGLRDAKVEALFAPLMAALPAITENALASQTPPREPSGGFPAEKQKTLARELLETMGFDFERGRLDESTHPFCGGSPGDIRITTRYDEDNPASGLMGVLHETGHALYEAGRPQRWIGQPVSSARGMAVHESQSLLMEMQVCRSPSFVRYLSGRLRSSLGDDPAFAPDNLETLYHRVERGFIRVDADETTYPMHVALRHELERAMITGDLAPRDLPLAWNERFEALMGASPPDDRMGCLQDIHWPLGAFGYFPSYTIGAVMAAQLFQSLIRAVPHALDEVGKGDFAPLLAWLRTHVHQRGSSVDAETLIEDATGAPLSTDAFLAHLRARYGA